MWKQISKAPLCEINEHGECRRISNKRVIKSAIDKGTGYERIALPIANRKRHVFSIHRLLMEAFVPNPENKQTVNHKNGIKHDNRLENLEWATVPENTQHAYNNNLIKHYSHEVILKINDELIEFPTMNACAKYLGVSDSNVYRRLTESKIRKKKDFKYKGKVIPYYEVYYKVLPERRKKIMKEKIVSNYEFSFILKKGEDEYDLGLADSITDSWTTNNTELTRFSYQGVVGSVATSANFSVEVTGVNDQHNATYKLFKKLYGGNLLDLQGFELEMTWPLNDDEETPQILTCPANVSFTAGFSAAANDLSRFSVTIFAAGAITVTPAKLKETTPPEETEE